MAKRYFERLTAWPGTDAFAKFGIGVLKDTTVVFAFVPYAYKRTVPTVSYSAVSDFKLDQGATAYTATALTTNDPTHFGCCPRMVIGTALTIGTAGTFSANNTASAYIDADAEL